MFLASAVRVLRAGVPARLHGAGAVHGGGGSSAQRRWTSSVVRRRRRAYYKAMADPTTSPVKLQRLRERAARPQYELLRYLAETKVARVQTQEDRKKLWYDLRYNRYAPLFLNQIKPRMKLWAAALHESQLPLARLPEIAMCGRSNSGKSTLVNYLCGQYCASMRRAPGSTTELYFWKVGRPAQLCLVDLPGYGFAEAPDEKRLQWTEFTLWYIRARKNLKRVLLLIDGRQGIKPADREMISYLERHNVPWQIIVTKSDKVPGKTLAKRITIMKEDLSQFRKMVREPIPVAAVKRRGLETLREILTELKVAKEVVKDGIRTMVYDLLEQRRVRNRAKRQRRKDRKEALKAELETKESETKESERAESDAEATNLHEILNSWGPGQTPKAAEEDSSAAKPGEPKPAVPMVSISLDDRDSQRVDGFMASLFPDFRAFAAATASAAPARVAQPGAAAVRFGAEPDASADEALREEPWPADAHSDDDDDARDDDSDDDAADITPTVQRFEPGLLAAEAKPKLQRFKTSKPSKIERFPSRVSILRPEPRPPGDIVYTEDDVMSPADYAAGFRRWAPPSPSQAGTGHFMAQARRRFEREWSMELEDVGLARAGAPDVEPKLAPRPSRASQSEELPKMPFVHQKGLRPIPKDHRGKSRILGRRPAKILKTKTLALHSACHHAWNGTLPVGEGLLVGRSNIQKHDKGPRTSDSTGRW
ncbi:unnamed protein product [Durusdinium trenchii]|uniref:EngB-type G domain-containing protein n=1 Tax=Durusdinium trenchii TaxID=1381693 RepID=A0ABP0JWU6_9DINO